MPLPGSLPARPRQSAIVYPTPEALAQDPGPRTDTRYAVVLSLGPTVFSWTLHDATAADDVNVVAPTGGSPGRWKRSRSDDRGADLSDSDQTLTVAGGRLRVLAPGTLTANRVVTLDDAGAEAGDEILIARNDVDVWTVTIANGGAGGGTVAVMPVSARSWCLARFDGTNWIHVASALSLSAF